MGRSLKKGPFVDGHLFEKIDRMNTATIVDSVRNGLRTNMGILLVFGGLSTKSAAFE